jgi:hypothetical protein
VEEEDDEEDQGEYHFSVDTAMEFGDGTDG